jgi:hypothetical protein
VYFRSGKNTNKRNRPFINKDLMIEEISKTYIFEMILKGFL